MRLAKRANGEQRIVLLRLPAVSLGDEDQRVLPGVWGNRINSPWQRTLFARFHIQDMRNKLVPLPVVPDDVSLRLRQPLQHAANSRLGFLEFDPLIAILQINHTDLYQVVGLGIAMLKADFPAERVRIAALFLLDRTVSNSTNL
ncbi:MAG: hypothetical protein KJZ78_07890 [Bryobacteraceae bacterium]|nr:hypothetical protein [Bryobacteraceae bacterium]